MYLIPYKSSQMLQRIYKSIEKINLVGIGHTEDDSVRMLTTKELSDEEKANRLLDVITGYEFMDAEFRIIVLEGIGGRGWSMHKFYEQNQREVANTRRCKMLYNPDIKFKDRMYLDFNVTLKKIKLRDTPTEIMASPDMYLRSKVP